MVEAVFELHAGLQRAGFDTVLLETLHVMAALSATTVKIDRMDARGIAQLIRMGWVPRGARKIDSGSRDSSAANASLRAGAT